MYPSNLYAEFLKPNAIPNAIKSRWILLKSTRLSTRDWPRYLVTALFAKKIPSIKNVKVTPVSDKFQLFATW